MVDPALEAAKEAVTQWYRDRNLYGGVHTAALMTGVEAAVAYVREREVEPLLNKLAEEPLKAGDSALIAAPYEALIAEMGAKLDAARKLHFATASSQGGATCGGCSHVWPCPTACALGMAATDG